MQDLLQLVVSGLATGAIYALVAIGFTLLWQTAGTVNFAQGEFVVLPAFLILGAMSFGHLPLLPAIVVGGGIGIVLLGFVFKRGLVDPMLQHGSMPLTIATMALALFIKEAVKDGYGAEAHPFPSVLPTGNFTVGGLALSVQSLFILLIAVVAVVALHLLLTRTRTGRCMQAAAQNASVARILGINVQRMILYTFLINAALVTLAALLVTPIYLAKFSNGESLGLAAFIAALVGGFNQVRGAIVGGLLLGVVDNLSAHYISATYRGAVPLLVLIAVILFRPQGLLGRAEERTV